MKKVLRQIGLCLSILLISVSLILPVSEILLPSFAQPLPGFQEKIKGHWSEKALRSQTLELYFPEYVEENFQKFNPSKSVTQSSVYSALNLLYSAHKLSQLEEKYDINRIIKRKHILQMLKEFCLKHGKTKTPELAFIDCEKLNQEERDILAILVDLKILSGVKNKRFAPEKEMTQSEAMIVVQRMYDYLEKTFSNTLPKSAQKTDFSVKHGERSYDNTEGVSFEENEKSILIKIIKRFSTPAYTMHVQRVFVSEKGFHIDLSVTSTTMDVAQVITYESVLIEIPKSDLTKNIPFKALIENMDFDSYTE